ncbi:exodeoxyribonuclease III [Gammaproteobacteria bacterium]
MRSMLTLMSFNVNGIRARPHQLQALAGSYCPDILGLQETKVENLSAPDHLAAGLGYRADWFGQKSHYGVALWSRHPARSITTGFPWDAPDAQRRVITGVYEVGHDRPLTVINAYFPQGESRDHPVKFPAKARFYADMARYLADYFDPSQPLVLMGDMNVAPGDADVGIGEGNARRWLRSGKCSFLPEERAWLTVLFDWGLFDLFRILEPVASASSWFDYRSRGFEQDPRHGLRIDLLLGTHPLRQTLKAAGIALDIRAMEKPSDHCPVWAGFDRSFASHWP